MNATVRRERLHVTFDPVELQRIDKKLAELRTKNSKATHQDAIRALVKAKAEPKKQSQHRAGKKG